MQNCINALQKAKRPILILGWGVHLASAEKEAIALSHKIPTILTWGAADLNGLGTFGTHGVRHANFAVQNADVVVSVGSRLDTKATGSPTSSFAPKAKLFMVDVDQAEINKFTGQRQVYGLCMDAKEALKALYQPYPDFSFWRSKINQWKAKYPIVPKSDPQGEINPYVFVDKLSDLLSPDDVIVSDTGCSLGWMMQAFRFKGQRFIHAFNNTPMGYGLAASIGAAFATNKRVVLITGDGGLSVNITEMATIARHKLPIKIILFNNRGHAMCRQTQRQWLNGNYQATSYEGGLATPDFVQIAKAYGIQPHFPYTFDCELQMQLDNGLLKQFLACEGSGLLNVKINPDQGIEPQVKFGHKLEDGEPLLPPEELREIMCAT